MAARLMRAWLSRPALLAALLYAALQLVIWAKSAWFFLQFGHGRAMLFNRAAFDAQALLFDHWFHFYAHALIFVLALAFGALLSKLEWKKLLALVFLAVALHNAAYWFTFVFESYLEIVLDFAFDFGALLVVVLLGHAARRLFWKK